MRTQARPIDRLRGLRGGRRAFVPIWRRPWMTLNADTYGSSVLATLGVDNVFAADADRYPTTTLADAARPPARTSSSRRRSRTRSARATCAELREVAADVRLVDGQDLFWWGVRTPAALERLRQSIDA